LALASPELNVLGLTICHGNLGDLDRLGKNARLVTHDKAMVVRIDFD
jgi:inosine-uridine nucleoside N-ribohydrolase